MARYNEILVGRYNRFMQKLLSMKGPASLTQLSGEVQTVFPFFSGVENRTLESWQRFGLNIQQTSLAANNSIIQIRNPVGSNIIAVFEKITDTNTQAAVNFNGLALGAKTSDLTTLVAPTNVVRMDPRGQQSTNLILSKQNSVGGGLPNSIAIWQDPVGNNYDVIAFEDQEVTLLPGDALQVVSFGLAVQLNDSFIWRERYLEDSERS
jgi:hypothetical protein